MCFVAHKGAGLMSSMKVPVTLRAVEQRINRRLAKATEVLKKTRGVRAKTEYGDYYILRIDTLTHQALANQS
jgi:hypothetical protein